MTNKIRILTVILLSCIISAAYLMLVNFNSIGMNIVSAASAQTEVPVSQASDRAVPDPADLFRNARLTYNGQMVVAASMREETLVHDRHVIGVGEYMEKIDNAKRYLRMEMNYSCDNVRQSVQYISDASKDMFWISKNIGSHKELFRIDAFKLNDQTANPELVSSIDGIPITPVSFAGIPFILSQIEKYYTFTSCSIIRDSQTSKPFYVIVGTWNPERFPMSNLVSEKGIKWDAVPPEIPDTIKIYLGFNDLFPYKIYYYRNVNDQPTLISRLTFYDVSFDVRLNTKQFGFSPSSDNNKPIDITNRYLKKKDKSNENTTIRN